MDQRTLQMIQRGLVAAVSVVLALIVITSFRGLLEPPGETIPRRTTTTDASAAGGDTSTTATTTTVTSATGDTTTSTALGTAVCTDQKPSSSDATVLQVYYPCGSSSFAGGTFVYRSVPKTDLVLTTTMKEMTKGLEPDEQELGFRSPFPASADGSFLGVSLDNGTAYVQFSAGIFPDGADTAEGSQIFLSTLNANVFQFDTINAVEYRLDGSCSAFFQQLGADCETITRAEWLSQQASP